MGAGRPPIIASRGRAGCTVAARGGLGLGAATRVASLCKSGQTFALSAPHGIAKMRGWLPMPETILEKVFTHNI